jgi:hypothetical protein
MRRTDLRGAHPLPKPTAELRAGFERLREVIARNENPDECERVLRTTLGICGRVEGHPASSETDTASSFAGTPEPRGVADTTRQEPVTKK